MGQFSQSKRKDIEHVLEIARVAKLLKTMGYDDNKEGNFFTKKATKKSNKYTKLRSEFKKLLPDLQKKLISENNKKEIFKVDNERLSIERDKTLADLGLWQDQISRHEGEVKFASFVKEVMCTELEDACKACLDAQTLLADIQSRNLTTKDMLAELESNKLGPSQIEQLKCVRDCLQALVEGRNEAISNEQRSIDELTQASKKGKDKVAELDGKIMNEISEMTRSQNKIIKIEKAIFTTKMQINLVKIDITLCKKILRKLKKGDY